MAAATTTASYSFTDEEVSRLAKCDDQPEFLLLYRRLLQSKGMESDLACIDQFCKDDILMIRFDDSKITTATVVPQSELTPSVAALFQ